VSWATVSSYTPLDHGWFNTYSTDYNYMDSCSPVYVITKACPQQEVFITWMLDS